MSDAAYLVSLSPIEQLAVDAVADDAAVWITQLVQKNCQIVIDQLVHDAVDRCLSRDLPIPPTREEIIKLSVTRGWAKILPAENK